MCKPLLFSGLLGFSLHLLASTSTKLIIQQDTGNIYYNVQEIDKMIYQPVSGGGGIKKEIVSSPASSLKIFFNNNQEVVFPLTSINSIVFNEEPLNTTTIKTPVLDAHVYPNPSSHLLNLEVEVGAQVFVYNLEGKLVHQFVQNSTLSSIDVSAWNNGLHILQIQQNQSIITKKFIKN